MPDGREIIEEVNKIVVDFSKRLEEFEGTFAAEDFSAFKKSIESSVKWVTLCRRKVWLRSAEGTKLAEGCLDAANRLQASLGDPAVANAEAADLASQLQTLAREIENNAQIIT